MIERVLEPEVMDGADEAREYDTLDHSAANEAFVDDLLQACPVLYDVLDVGTGTAQIPVELCRRVDTCRVMAADMSCEMLDLARYHVEVHGMIERIQLDQCDAKQMLYQDRMFDVVICNGMLHHIPDPTAVLAESIRVSAPGGMLFFRDLMRPVDCKTLEQLVTTHVGQANERQQQLFRQSLHAALNLDEIRAIVVELGFDAQSVQATSERHWTWRGQR